MASLSWDLLDWFLVFFFYVFGYLSYLKHPNNASQHPGTFY